MNRYHKTILLVSIAISFLVVGCISSENNRVSECGESTTTSFTINHNDRSNTPALVLFKVTDHDTIKHWASAGFSIISYDSINRAIGVPVSISISGKRKLHSTQDYVFTERLRSTITICESACSIYGHTTFKTEYDSISKTNSRDELYRCIPLADTSGMSYGSVCSDSLYCI